MARRTLIIFAKAPRRGLVKSRLARDIGAAAATRWYRQNLATTLRRLGLTKRWECRIIAAPYHAVTWPWPKPWRFSHQARGDLGQRMLKALRSATKGPTVLIGSDIPGIEPQHIATAFNALERNDAVFGPSADGGYWLVGFSPRYRGNPFTDVRWSTEWALEDTLAGFRPGTRIGFAAEMRDVDEATDLPAA
ncbi:TIGR04282 family arsenosugar biosynthesis glycosyltransferase [Nisaea denitrificans]|uniref:TIGR04282 family arsenosugar biosynthesis glycosyltransferase n=1 Tax=Nisaea denitrificans TaxID=390877 RepID=UPI00041A53A6|nr:TIGR04282 family arsenosugar biosynthesis glycosyltransferase [Nisaea denitrificans]